jgi:hypothetical protein
MPMNMAKRFRLRFSSNQEAIASVEGYCADLNEQPLHGWDNDAGASLE